ncbi:MAG: MgtC/SapB family protein, partial [Alphaproteobacteria bacterium]|nr:MgtC/SapB family protein [Alphaproteobacteria bacterium]
YMAVSVGACIFSLISDHVLNDASRIAAQIVSGIGFIGGGIILQTKGKTTGLTTAATLWATAGIGMASAYGFYILAAEGTILVLFILILHRLSWWKF